jgi:hypothetical protein
VREKGLPDWVDMGEPSLKILKVRDIAIQLDREDAQELAEWLDGEGFWPAPVSALRLAELLNEALKGEVPF